MKRIFVATAFAGFIAAPALAQETPAALQAAFSAGIVAEDADAVAALYTADADSYPPGGAVAKGTEAIAASWAGFFDAFDGFSISLDQQGERKMGKNDHAAWGLWTMSATPADGGDRVVWTGRFLDVSIKTKEGWRYIVDHASMTPPEPDAVNE